MKCKKFNFVVNLVQSVQLLDVQVDFATNFLQRLHKDIRTNPFEIHVGNLWQASTNFVLDPYVATNYCTSYLTKIDNMLTNELKVIIANSNEKNRNTYSYSKDEKCII